MAADNGLAKLDRARQLLADACTAPMAKDIADTARAAEIFFRRQGASQEVIAHAVAIKIEALTRLGELYGAGPKAQGTRGNFRGRDSSGGVKITPPENLPSLDVLGIGKEMAKEMRALAAMKCEEPELHEKVRT